MSESELEAWIRDHGVKMYGQVERRKLGAIERQVARYAAFKLLEVAESYCKDFGDPDDCDLLKHLKDWCGVI